MPDRITRCVFLLLIAVAISAASPRPTAVPVPNPAPHWVQVEGVRIVYLQGDPYEMGLQQGTSFRQPLREFVRDYLYGHLVSAYGASHFGLLAYARSLEEELPADLRREMQGIAVGANLTYQDVLLLNAVPDLLALTYQLPALELSLALFPPATPSRKLPQFSMARPLLNGAMLCSHFAVWGRATTDSELLVGHNLGSVEADLLGPYLLVVVRQPSQGNAFVSLGLMGMVGVWAGMNEEKISVSLSSSPSVDIAWDGQPLPFLLRRVLHSAGDLTEAVNILLGARRLCGGNVLLGDGKAPAAIAIELSAHRQGIFEAGTESELLVRTNHFLGTDLALTQRGLLSGQEKAASEARLGRLAAVLEVNRGWIGIEKALAFLRDDQDIEASGGYGFVDPVYQVHALQSALLYPGKLTVWVGQDTGAASPGPHTRLDFSMPLLGYNRAALSTGSAQSE